MLDTLLLITGLLTALTAGIFFAYSVSVNGGLHRLKDGEYIRAMQSINVVIQNPLFFLAFMGPVVLLPLVAFMHGVGSNQFLDLIAASVIYIIGSFGLTAFGNVPLNDKLAKVDSERMSDAELAKARAAFEKPWNVLHEIRTIASVIALALVFSACLL
ncbi:anthrone oxygenase family protein [Streptomyces sp. NPDC051662]|uniref:anthrone oxygenase family protein n=1 Tax=Streptomyces sp. NPDC051662 TaxID=3154750 RepID=UPI0034499FB3